MTKLKRLIEELCPDGVEYEKLEVITDIQRGERVTKAELLNDGKYPVISGGVTPMGYINKFNRDNETITIAQYGTAGYIDWQKGKFWANDVCYSIFPRKSISNRYLYYCLMNLQGVLYSLKTNAIPAHLPLSLLKQVKVPLPPLPVQEEIVRILDNFMELTAELTAELKARRKQFEHYRDELLSFGDEVEWRTLEEVGMFKYGYTDKASDKGDVRFIRITDINENGKLKEEEPKYISLTKESEEYLVKEGDLLMARTGATYGKTMLFDNDIPSVYASFLIRIRFKEKQVLPKYYWHFSQSNHYWIQANSYVSKAGQPQFNANALRRVKIPIPPPSEQERIVAILDKFDALINDITIGLPAEIEVRQKQYNYYREKLLTFRDISDKGA